jgi:hypothetical protein
MLYGFLSYKVSQDHASFLLDYNDFGYDLMALLMFHDDLESDKSTPSGTVGNIISNTGTFMLAPFEP